MFPFWDLAQAGFPGPSLLPHGLCVASVSQHCEPPEQLPSSHRGLISSSPSPTSSEWIQLRPLSSSPPPQGSIPEEELDGAELRGN